MCSTAGVYANDVVGYCGGRVSIRCEYDVQYGRRPKYFCQGEQNDCREKIRTSTKNKWVTKDRFSLFDNGTHYFIAGISDLSPSDTGKYWCGVSLLGGGVVQSEVNLEVKDELSTCGMTVLSTSYVGESLNVTCPYSDVHTHAAKYLCKSYRSQNCDYKVSVHTDSTWLHSDKVSLYDDRGRRAFTAVLGSLGVYDRGSYWCGVETGWEHGGEDGYRALIRKLQLTMAETRPTYSVSTERSTHPQKTAAPETTSAPLPVLSTAADTPPGVMLTTTSGPVHISTEPIYPPTATTGQSSLLPDKAPVSTSVPVIIEDSSGLWRMVVYAIVALLALVILCAILLLIIRHGKRARTAGYSPSHMSMEALWKSPLQSNSMGYLLNPSEFTSLEPNTSEPEPAESKAESEVLSSAPDNSESKPEASGQKTNDL
ncbi:hypothetical protein ACEWY4_017280 [Coilia grayii]|uniref:Immunoglobulin domain-containing protein n=1 Tax=Coilia grayii TaxID=363190 RepID=A0ABD1JHK2_9TELE